MRVTCLFLMLTGTMVKYSENSMPSSISNASAQKPQASSGGGTVNSLLNYSRFFFYVTFFLFCDVSVFSCNHCKIINMIWKLQPTGTSCTWYYGSKKGTTEGSCATMASKMGTWGRFIGSFGVGSVYFFWPLKSMVCYRVYGSHNQDLGFS